MKRSYLAIWGILGFCSFAWIAFCGDKASDEKVQWGDEVQGVKLAITLPKDILHIGESVQLHVMLKNISNKEEGNQRYCDTGTLSGFGFTVHDANGKSMPTLPNMATKRLMAERLLPGDMIETNVYLSDICNLAVPGKYTIQASRKFPLFSFGRPPEGDEIKSNIVAFTVVEAEANGRASGSGRPKPEGSR